MATVEQCHALLKGSLVMASPLLRFWASKSTSLTNNGTNGTANTTDPCITQREELKKEFGKAYNATYELYQETLIELEDKTCEITANTTYITKKATVEERLHEASQDAKRAKEYLDEIIEKREAIETAVRTVEEKTEKISEQCSKRANVTEYLKKIHKVIESLEKCPDSTMPKLELPHAELPAPGNHEIVPYPAPLPAADTPQYNTISGCPVPCPVPVPVPVLVPMRDACDVCTEFRSGAIRSDLAVCKGPMEAFGAPCYPLNSDGSCNGDWTKLICSETPPPPAPEPAE